MSYLQSTWAAMQVVADFAMTNAERLRNVIDHGHKNDGTVITMLDHSISDLALNLIKPTLPDNTIWIDEEKEALLPQTFNPFHEEGRYIFIIDPVDGTRHYKNGYSEYLTMMALYKNIGGGKIIPLIALAVFPATGEIMWHIQRRGDVAEPPGTWYQASRTMQAKAVTKPCPSMDMAAFTTRRANLQENMPGKPRMVPEHGGGPSGTKARDVVLGRCCAFIFGGNAWDLMPMLPFISAAKMEVHIPGNDGSVTKVNPDTSGVWELFWDAENKKFVKSRPPALLIALPENVKHVAPRLILPEEND